MSNAEDDDDTVLEQKARDVLGWSDDRIARTRRLDMIDALDNHTVCVNVPPPPEQYPVHPVHHVKHASTCKPRIRSAPSKRLITLDDLRAMQSHSQVFQQAPDGSLLTQKNPPQTLQQKPKKKRKNVAEFLSASPKNNTAEELSKYCIYLHKKQVGYSGALQKKLLFQSTNKEKLDLHDQLVLDASIHNTQKKKQSIDSDVAKITAIVTASITRKKSLIQLLQSDADEDEDATASVSEIVNKVAILERILDQFC